MRKKTILWLALLPAFYSCKHKQGPQSYFDPHAPKVVAANGYVLPADSVAPPEVLPVVNVKRILAGKPKVIPVVSNIHPVGAPEIVPAGNPEINTPGQGAFKMPDVVDGT